MNTVESFASLLGSGRVTGIAAFGVALLGGIVAGFGPCVLPMMPAVFGYVTGQTAEAPQGPRFAAWSRGLALSAVFVLGMSLVFAALGAAAGAVGHAVLVGAWAFYVVAAVCLALGLQMLGLVDLHLDTLNRFLPVVRPERRGVVGALLFGVGFGVIASPCSTPILAAIATIAAARGSAMWGALLLFVYGLGKGVPLMLLGFASGSLTLSRSLARASGMLTKIGGAALVGAAAYLVWLA